MAGVDEVELRWPGKYVDGERARLVDHGAELRERERLGEPSDNRVICGDNLLVLEALVREAPGSVDLVYIDPPFATGNRFALSRRVGDKKAGTEAELRLPAFDDAWKGGVAGFLRMLDPRLRLIHQLLAPTGSLYVHVDPTVGHAVKLMLDELFGPGCFQREIVWRIGWVSGFKTRARNWIRNHDSIFFYTKNPKRFVFNKMWVPHPKGYVRREGKAAKAPGIAIDDVWNAGAGELELSGPASLDSIQIKSFSREKTGWATQKNESLLERIIAASSAPGALVADLFGGSGTTAKVAAQLGRRFLVCDHADAAVQITRNRLLAAGHSFEVHELDARERSAALEQLAQVAGQAAAVEQVVRGWLLAQLGADEGDSNDDKHSASSPSASAFAARRGEIGLALALPGERVDATRVAALRAAAKAAALAGVELLAFDYEGLDDAQVGEAEAVDPHAPLLLEAGRGLFDAAARATPWIEGGVAVWERPTLRVALEPLAEAGRGRVRLTLVELVWRAHQRLPAALRERAFGELLLGWSVADARAPTQPLFVAARNSVREPLALEAELELEGCVELWIVCEDVCGHRHQRRLRL